VLQYCFNWKTLSVMAGLTFWNFYFKLYPGAIRSHLCLTAGNPPGGTAGTVAGSPPSLPPAGVYWEVPMLRKPLLDATVLQAALEGLEQQRLETEKRIATVRALLGARKPKARAAPASVKPKRTISAAGRKRIAAAQRKRWAALKKAKEESAPKKRRLSAEGRRSIIEATKKRWAEFRAKKAAKEAKAAARKA